MQSKSDLAKIVDAVHPASRLTCSLDGWQEQSHQNPKDREAHKQLDKRERLTELVNPHRFISP
jgi:hypothetical protein